jgi:hypothetical protein
MYVVDAGLDADARIEDRTGLRPHLTVQNVRSLGFGRRRGDAGFLDNGNE